MKNTKVKKVGIVGLGTVGSGTAQILKTEAARLSSAAGSDVTLVLGCDVRDDAREAAGLTEAQFTKDWKAVVTNPEIDIVVELIGGTGLAHEVIIAALKNGKHVVTANKALLSLKGDTIFAAAAEAGKTVAFEAAVCGGIPVVRALREGLVANKVLSIAGVVNGTANFILTKMSFEGKDFASALKEAQALGFAEADPTLDIEGGDTAHKLSILASIAFGSFFPASSVSVKGITKVTDLDIRYADEMGFRIKLLALAAREDGGDPYLFVAPTLIPKTSMLGNVLREFNGVVVNGDSVGPVLFTGKGAGSKPTGSAVVADIIHLAAFGDCASTRYPMYPLHSTGKARNQEEFEAESYIRLAALDKPGVMARVSGVIGEAGISIATLVQKQNTEEGDAVIVIKTHKTAYSRVKAAVAALEKLDIVRGSVAEYRIIRDRYIES